MANLAQTALGIGSGAATGATIGSMIPVVGTGLGAVGGGILGLLGSLTGGGEGKQSGVQQTQTMSQPQMQLQNQVLQQLMGSLQNPQARYAGFDPIAQQARENFQQRTIPTIAERFTSMGGQRSSAFKQALGSAGAGLETDLAAMRANYGLQNQGLLQQLAPLAMQPQFSNYYQAYQPSFGESSIANLLQILPQLLQMYQAQQGMQPTKQG